MSRFTFLEFKAKFDESVKSFGIDWIVSGFYAPNGKIYPFGTDTKVLSTVFEALSAPIIEAIATEHGYCVEGAPQTVYPDFTLTPLKTSSDRIAIDIKTTYRRFSARNVPQQFRYTLGSYTSFLRSTGAKKNILYPYSEYAHHWVIGFLYTRTAGTASKVYASSAGTVDVTCPYKDVEYFVQEKHKIVGLTPASGNTANIGSFPTASIRDLQNGIGPFAKHGKEICDEYWRNYGRTSADREYATVEEFLRWRQRDQP
jgi:hypothetical protein